MKTLSNTLRSLIATAAVGIFTSFAYAGPGIQQWKTLGTETQFNELKEGSTVAYACNTCKSISGMTVKSPAHAMELCKEGGSVACPSCKQVTKVVRKRAREDAPTHTEISYVNDKGEACAFIAAPRKM